MLREQIEIEEDEIRQNYKSSDVNRHETKLSTSATACFPKRIEEKCEGNDDAFDNIWIRPKKCMPSKYFDTKSKIKEEHDVENNKSKMLIDMNNNKHNVLSCEDEKEEVKEHHATACEEESSVVMENEEMNERDKMKSNDNEIEHETSNQVSKEEKKYKASKQESEKGCGKCNMSKENIISFMTCLMY